MAAVTICSDFGAPKIKSDTVSTVSPSISHEVMGPDATIFVFWMLSFRPTFSLSLSLSSRGFLVPLYFLPLGWCHLHIWGYWYFCWQSWFQFVLHPAWHFAWCHRWQDTALMYSFPNMEPVHCFMSGSNCYFLTCIQISQEAGKVVWYSQLLKNFPQLVVIHTVKGFSIVNEADVFLEFSCFFYDLTDIGNLISVPLPFLNPIWTSESSQFTYCWSLTWRFLALLY